MSHRSRRLAILTMVGVVAGSLLQAKPALAAPSNLQYNNGPLINVPKAYVDYWGTEWTTNFYDPPYSSGQAQTYVNTFFAGIGGSPWLGTLTQYNIINRSGQWQPQNSWPDAISVPAPNSWSDGAVQAELARAVAHFGDHYNWDAVYFIVTGPGQYPMNGNGSYGCSPYHHYETINGIQYAYAYIAYAATCPPTVTPNSSSDSFGHGHLDGFGLSLGHEYAEAITDPQNDPCFSFECYGRAGWWDTTCGGGSCPGNEVGDKCATGGDQQLYGDVWLGGQFFAVQGLWSNSINGCSLGAGWHPIDRAYPGQALSAGQELISLPSNRYRLIMQGDGNLVLYSPTTYLWASWTQNHPSDYALMQGDGNLVIYRQGGSIADWSSRTAGNPGGVLVMQDDGNLVIYRPGAIAIWSSRTCCYRP